MIIFYKFEHSSLPISTMKQKQIDKKKTKKKQNEIKKEKQLGTELH